jgi:hypothetical protein
MSNFSDKTLARRLLETRYRDCSFGLFYRRSAKRYVFLVSFFILALVTLSSLQQWMGCSFTLGMFFGCILRDVGWVRAVRKTWPFSVKVTDWDKVQKLAGGETAA